MLGAAAAAAVCLSAAGCGSQSQDPLAGLTAKQIMTKAYNDLKSASAVTMSGTAPVDGKPMTMSIGIRNGGCTMSMATQSQGSATIIVIGKTMWMKADDKFMQSQGGGGVPLNMFKGKYIKLPASAGQAFTQSAGGCSVKSLTSGSSPVSMPKDTVKGAVTTVNGQRVYPLTDKSQGATVYVTDTSTPQIIKVVSSKSGDSGQMSLTYGVPKSVTAPPASQTVTMPGLGS